MADKANSADYKVLLVCPSNKKEYGNFLSPPLWPAIFKTLSPEDVDVSFVHIGRGIEKVTEKKLSGYDLVGISIVTAGAPAAYDVADLAMKAGAKVVLGGLHVYAMPNEARRHCHSIIIGEGETVWPSVLDDARNGRLKPEYQSRITEPDEFVVPDFSIYRKYSYLFNRMYEPVRGCPFSCDFCSANLYRGSGYRYMSEATLRKILDKWVDRRRVAILFNTNLIANPERSASLLKVLAEYNFRWWSTSSVNILDHPHLMDLCAEAGAVHLQFGFESINPSTLKSMNKKQNIGRDYRRLSRELHDRGIMASGSFIFGFDTDTTSTFKKTTDFACSADMDIIVYGPLIPFPGTRVFENMASQKRILTIDWSRYDGTDVVFQPKNMTREQLLDGLISAYEGTWDPLNTAKKITRSLYETDSLRQLVGCTALLCSASAGSRHFCRRYREAKSKPLSVHL